MKKVKIQETIEVSKKISNPTKEAKETKKAKKAVKRAVKLAKKEAILAEKAERAALKAAEKAVITKKVLDLEMLNSQYKVTSLGLVNAKDFSFVKKEASECRQLIANIKALEKELRVVSGRSYNWTPACPVAAKRKAARNEKRHLSRLLRESLRVEKEEVVEKYDAFTMYLDPIRVVGHHECVKAAEISGIDPTRISFGFEKATKNVVKAKKLAKFYSSIVKKTPKTAKTEKTATVKVIFPTPTFKIASKKVEANNEIVKNINNVVQFNIFKAPATKTATVEPTKTATVESISIPCNDILPVMHTVVETETTETVVEDCVYTASLTPIVTNVGVEDVKVDTPCCVETYNATPVVIVDSYNYVEPTIEIPTPALSTEAVDVEDVEEFFNSTECFNFGPYEFDIEYVEETTTNTNNVINANTTPNPNTNTHIEDDSYEFIFDDFSYVDYTNDTNVTVDANSVTAVLSSDVFNSKYEYISQFLKDRLLTFSALEHVEIVSKNPKCFKNGSLHLGNDLNKVVVEKLLKDMQDNNSSIMRVAFPQELKMGLNAKTIIKRGASIVSTGFCNMPKIKIDFVNGVYHFTERTNVMVKNSPKTGPFKKYDAKVLVGSGSGAYVKEVKNFITDCCIFECTDAAVKSMFTVDVRFYVNPSKNKAYFQLEKGDGGYDIFNQGHFIEVNADNEKAGLVDVTEETLLSDGYVRFCPFRSTDSQDRTTLKTFECLNDEFTSEQVFDLVNRQTGGGATTLKNMGEMDYKSFAKAENRISLVGSGGSPLCALEDKNVVTLPCKLHDVRKDLPKTAEDGMTYVIVEFIQELFNFKTVEEAYGIASQMRSLGAGIMKGQLQPISRDEVSVYIKMLSDNGKLNLEGKTPEEYLKDIVLISDGNGTKLDTNGELITLHFMAFAKDSNESALSHQIVEQTLVNTALSFPADKASEAKEAIKNVMNMYKELYKENIDRDFQELETFLSGNGTRRTSLPLYKNFNSDGSIAVPFRNDLLSVVGDNAAEGTMHPSKRRAEISALLGKAQQLTEKFHIGLKGVDGENLMGTRVAASDPCAMLFGPGVIIKEGEIFISDIGKKIDKANKQIAKGKNVEANKAYLESHRESTVFKQPMANFEENYKAVNLSLEQVIERIEKEGKKLVTDGKISFGQLTALISRIKNSAPKAYVPAIEWIIKLLAGMDFDWDKVIFCLDRRINELYRYNSKEKAFSINADYSLVGNIKIDSGLRFNYSKATAKQCHYELLNKKKTVSTENIGDITHCVNKLQRLLVCLILDWATYRNVAINWIKSIARCSTSTGKSYVELTKEFKITNGEDYTVDYIDCMINSISKVELNKENVIAFIIDATKGLRLYQEGTIDAPKKAVYFVNRLKVNNILVSSLFKVKKETKRGEEGLVIAKRDGLTKSGKKQQTNAINYDKDTNTIKPDYNTKIDITVLNDHMGELMEYAVYYFNVKLKEFITKFDSKFKLSDGIVKALNKFQINTKGAKNQDLGIALDKLRYFKGVWGSLMSQSMKMANDVIESLENCTTEKAGEIMNDYINLGTTSIQACMDTFLCDTASSDSIISQAQLFGKGVLINDVTYRNKDGEIVANNPTTFALNMAPEATMSALGYGKTEIPVAGEAYSFNKMNLLNLIGASPYAEVELVNGLCNEGGIQLVCLEKYTGKVRVYRDGAIRTALDLEELANKQSKEDMYAIAISNFVDLKTGKPIDEEELQDDFNDGVYGVEINLDTINGVKADRLYVIDADDKTAFIFDIDQTTADLNCQFSGEVTRADRATISTEEFDGNRRNYDKKDVMIIVVEQDV